MDHTSIKPKRAQGARISFGPIQPWTSEGGLAQPGAHRAWTLLDELLSALKGFRAAGVRRLQLRRGLDVVREFVVDCFRQRECHRRSMIGQLMKINNFEELADCPSP